MKWLLFFLLIPSFCICQETATTESGKKVILNKNGTWEYAKNKPSTISELTCEAITETTTDKVTGETSTATKDYMTIGTKTKGFDIILLNSKSSVLVFNITVNGTVGCIDKGQKANILFRDGTRLELSHASKFNCGNDFTVYLGGVWNTTDQLQELRTKEVETLRVWGSSGFVESDFTQYESKKLLKGFQCLYEKL
jgi:hypothetical protein